MTSATYRHTGTEATQTHALQKESVVRDGLAKRDLAMEQENKSRQEGS